MTIKYNQLVLKTVQETMDKYGCYSKASKYLNCNRNALHKFVKENNIKFIKKITHKHSEETKKILSLKIKEYLKNNPDKHTWKRNDKFKSIPCEKIKEFLKQENIQFVSEFNPNISNRFFSIDIALPDKMIALEINGNQHYEKNGLLKPYYKERHNLLESYGWKVYEIHYSLCFNIEKWKNFINDIKNKEIISSFNYFTYKPIEKIQLKNKCSICQKDISKYAHLCKKCAANSKPNKCPISRDELQLLVLNESCNKISKKFNVSFTVVINWCKKYNITRPHPTYWNKKYGSDGIVFQKHPKKTDYEHGLQRYRKMKCRCDVCRKSNTDSSSRKKAKRRNKLLCLLAYNFILNKVKNS